MDSEMTLITEESRATTAAATAATVAATNTQITQ